MVTAAKIEEAAPQRLKMSYEEYLALPDEAKIREWVEGEVIVYMPPIYEHQNITLFLAELLNAFIRYFDLGILLLAPFEVKLWPDGPSREPDILFVSNPNRAKLTEKRFEGGPDLIIEIVSPGSVSEDRVRKFAQYEQAEVKEYWIIDPRPHQQQVDFYRLAEDKLFHAAPLTDDGRYYSSVLPHFWFDLTWLWQEPLPNPQLILAEIMISIEELPAEVKAAYQALGKILAARANK